VNNLDTCNGNYNDAIELIQNKSIEEITLNEIAQLRCLKYQTEPVVNNEITENYKKAIADSNFEKIIIYGKELLKNDFANPYLHNAVAHAAKALGNTVELDYHSNYILKHFQSFSALGNGNSIESPLQAFSIGEEYDWLSAMGYKRGNQSKVVNNGRHFDVHKVKNKDGKSSSVYFDITGYWFNFHKMFTDTTNNKKTIIFR